MTYGGITRRRHPSTWALHPYAGVNDKWKPIKSPDDGGQRTTVRNLDERFSQICFVVVTHNNQSPIVRFTTRP